MKQYISSTRDGFRLKDRFALPKNISGLDLKSMHANRICDLFLNENLLHLRDIVRLVRDDRGSVIHTLLEQGVIEERRKKRRDAFACPN
jgi:hypothetical protein